MMGANTSECEELLDLKIFSLTTLSCLVVWLTQFSYSGAGELRTNGFLRSQTFYLAFGSFVEELLTEWIKFSKIITSILIIILMVSGSHADRIKDIADVAGVRSNQLIGYGLVGGLSGHW